ncbi:hypothetical protein GCM10009087_17860 [Sphingomonas oligophenolica]
MPEPRVAVITVRIREASRITGIGRSKLYELIGAGDIETIKVGTITLIPIESHRQLDTHLRDFIGAYNFGRRLKTLKGLTPFEYICKIWTIEPDRFTLDPTHQMPGLNN